MKETDEEGDQEESGEDDDEEDEEEANGNCEENAGDKPAVKRDGTMVVTAAVRSVRVSAKFVLNFAYRRYIFPFQEGEKFLENEGHTVDGGTRGETEAVKAAIEESEADKQNGEKEEDKQDLKRKGTMQETVEVRKKSFFFLFTGLLSRFSGTAALCSKDCSDKIACKVLFVIVTWKFKL